MTRTRPSIFEYESINAFVSDMLNWRRTVEADFSVRSAASGLGCSPTLVSQVVKGRRKLTRDRVEDFCRLLRLSHQESRYLDQWVAYDRRFATSAAHGLPKLQVDDARPPLSRPKNHLMSHWLHPYVLEACRLRGFRADLRSLQRALSGIATLPQIRRSFDFLLREGFLRRSIGGHVQPNDQICITTDGVPDKKIRAFHKQALEIAKKGLERYSVSSRRSETYVLAVNEENLEKLKQILTNCMDQVEEFEREHPHDNERLYQISLHLTPVGGRVGELH